MQKFRDLLLLIQKDKKAQFFTLLAVLAILWIAFSPPPRQRRAAQKAPEDKSGTVDGDEAYRDIVRAFGSELENTKGEVKLIKEQLIQTEGSIQEFQNSSAEIFKKMLERLSEVEANTKGGIPSAGPIDVEGSDESLSLDGDGDALESFGELQTEPAPPAPPEPQKVAFVGAGDSVRIKLLAGVNAPTDGTPYPVVFQLSGDVFGPDNSQLPLGEARLIAAAQGSLTDSRALFRLTSMNIRLPNGRRKVLPVDGWVVGEDGIRGMEGVLIDPLGKAIGAAGFAGFLQGVGEGISSSNTTSIGNAVGGTNTFVSGDITQFAAGKGVSSAANVYARLIQDRVNALVPVVQVLSGREATAVFSKSISVQDLYEALDEEDSGFSDLD